ncbi:unnamed protein product [Cochlearia groenlandica]
MSSIRPLGGRSLNVSAKCGRYTCPIQVVLLAISPSSCIGYSRPVHLLDMDSVIHIGRLLDRYLWSILHILSSSYVFDIMPLWVTISLNTPPQT